MIVLPLLALAAACGDTAGDTGDARPARAAAAAPAHPCDAFTTEDVAAEFGVAIDAVTTRRDPAPGNASCAYRWDRADREAIEERNRTTAMEMLRSGTGGIPRMESTENELFITFHEGDYRTTDEAIVGFDQMVDRLTRGVSAGAGDAAFEMQATFEPVADVGARAGWSDELRQLSVVGGSRLFHVRVRTDEARGADRAAAESVARRIAAKL